MHLSSACSLVPVKEKEKKIKVLQSENKSSQDFRYAMSNLILHILWSQINLTNSSLHQTNILLGVKVFSSWHFAFFLFSKIFLIFFPNLLKYIVAFSMIKHEISFGKFIKSVDKTLKSWECDWEIKSNIFGKHLIFIKETLRKWK